jgi:hypothetical protein
MANCERSTTVRVMTAMLFVVVERFRDGGRGRCTSERVSADG